MANLVLCLSSRCPSKFVKVTTWEHFTFQNNIFGCGKVYFSNPIIIDKLERILTMVYVEHGYLVSGLYPLSSVQKNKSDKNTFWRLDLSPSSGGWGRVDLFSWAR
jgi:hypothetical protein